MSDVRLTITDCRRAGYCVSGVRRRFNELGLDFRRLVKDGIPLEELLSVEDGGVKRCIEVALRRIQNGR